MGWAQYPHYASKVKWPLWPFHPRQGSSPLVTKSVIYAANESAPSLPPFWRILTQSRVWGSQTWIRNEQPLRPESDEISETHATQALFATPRMRGDTRTDGIFICTVLLPSYQNYNQKDWMHPEVNPCSLADVIRVSHEFLAFKFGHCGLLRISSLCFFWLDTKSWL